jgi:hypothetical protein
MMPLWILQKLMFMVSKKVLSETRANQIKEAEKFK